MSGNKDYWDTLMKEFNSMSDEGVKDDDSINK